MSDIPFADHTKMDARADLAEEFYRATGARMAPFVSDEAKWWDFDYVEPEELFDRVEAHYGVHLTEENLKMPFWRLLDYIQQNRRRAT